MAFSSSQLNPNLWAHYDEHSDIHGVSAHQQQQQQQQQHLSAYSLNHHQTGPSSDGLSPLSGNPNDNSPQQALSSDSHDINALLSYDTASTTIQNLNDFLHNYPADPAQPAVVGQHQHQHQHHIYVDHDLLGPLVSNGDTKPNENSFQTDFFKTTMPELMDLSLPSSSVGGGGTNSTSGLAAGTSEEFTPLLSPAVTPFESISSGMLPAQDFIMPVPYVEESMPANEYQQQQQQQHHHHHHQQQQQQQPLKQEVSKTSRPMRTTPGMVPYISSRQQSSRVVKQSPLIKPSRKGSSSSSTKHSAISSPVIATSRKSSLITDGVNDISMPPPRKSSLVSSSLSTTGSSAVTPASLMNLPGNKDVEMLDSAETEQHLRNAVMVTAKIANTEVKRKNKFISPAPIAISPSMAIRGRQRSNVPLSPRVPVALSPKVATAPGSSSNTPLIKAKVPSTSASTSASISSTNGRRSGRPTVTPSPSLRPKISPLLAPNNEPKPATTARHHRSASSSNLTALLASKSNYQNIMEGNHVQLGLSYPEQLSAEITSKRTSHKLAEQGRRNRINSALSDLGAVLGEGFEASSKASIVEMSILYIKALKHELDVTKARLSKYEDVKESVAPPTNPEFAVVSPDEVLERSPEGTENDNDIDDDDDNDDDDSNDEPKLELNAADEK